MDGQIDLVLAWRLLSTSLTLCYKEIQDLEFFFISPPHIDRRNVLSTYLKKVGHSERDKLGRCRSTKLKIPPSFDARPL